MTNTDLVAVLPGITGSTLKHNGKPVWDPSAGAIVRAIRTLGRSLKQLQVPKCIGDDHPNDGVEPVALMPYVHGIPGICAPIQGYTSLLERLEAMQRAEKIGKVLPFPYDWRLSNRYNAERLADFIKDELGQWRDSHPSRAEAQVVLVCHSMGGLVARWYIEKCGGAEVSRKLITLGTPYRGAARTIDELVNGVRRGLGPLTVDLTDFARSLPSTYQLLPDYACINDNGNLFRLDEVNVPDLDTPMLADSLQFHRKLAAAEAARPASIDTTHAIVGTRQPTATTVRLTHNGIEVLETIGSDNDYGDSTVPLAGAIGHDLPLDTNRIWRIVDNHGHLQGNPFVLDEIESIITAAPVKRRGGGTTPIRVKAPELVVLGEPIDVTVDIEPDNSGRVPGVQVQLIPERSTAQSDATTRFPEIHDRQLETTFNPSQPGAYQISVAGTGLGSPVAPVTATVLVWPPEEDGRP
jgi:pimeloyl-ACP methyl ester carboxylesterase